MKTIKEKRTRAKRITPEKIMQFEAAFCPFRFDETEEALGIALKAGMSIEEAVKAVQEYGENNFLANEHILLREAVLTTIKDRALEELSEALSVIYFGEIFEVNDSQGNGVYYLFDEEIRNRLFGDVRRSNKELSDFSKPTQFFLKSIKENN